MSTEPSRSYMVRIEGRGVAFEAKDRVASVLGFLGLGKTTRCVGFFATKYVDSETEAAATQLARKLVTDELLERGLLSPPDLARLELQIDEVAVVPEAHHRQPNVGFTFFEK